jgi:heptose I phosphotransferase
MNHGSLWRRLVRGTQWTWLSETYRDALPADIVNTVMTLRATDRYHAKQGRSTARVRFDSPDGPLSVYLKRHERLPWTARLAALLNPSGRHTPASAEWAHLEQARKLGIRVPEVVAAGETIGPWGRLQSFLMVAELTGCRELNEALPVLDAALSREQFRILKRRLAIEVAAIAATLHAAKQFHKDLYLCHFFIDMSRAGADPVGLSLIDLHRLGRHSLLAARWRWKDLAQLLYSTYDVAAIDDRDRLRFWKHYRKEMRFRFPTLEARAIRAKAARYLAHNR